MTGRALLLLGQARINNNGRRLVRAVVSRPDLSLSLAGVGKVKGNPRLAGDVEDAASGEDVTLAFGRVPAAVVPVWHAASNVIVLPYSTLRTLHSGPAIMALSCGRPVVVSPAVIAREPQALAGTNWVRRCEGTPEQFLGETAPWGNQPRGEAPGLRALNWRPLAPRTVWAYQRALPTKRRACRRNRTT